MNKEEELLSYRNGITLEHKIEQFWYKSPCPFTIMLWSAKDAREEFARDTLGICLPQTKANWLKSVTQVEGLIKKSLAEALLSKSEYVRTYAELLMNKKT